MTEKSDISGNANKLCFTWAVFHMMVMSYIWWSSVKHGLCFIRWVMYYTRRNVYDGDTFIYTDIVPLA